MVTTGPLTPDHSFTEFDRSRLDRLDPDGGSGGRTRSAPGSTVPAPDDSEREALARWLSV
jgi:hypothetical protein